MYAIHYIGGAINVKKMPKKQAVEYAKQINDNALSSLPRKRETRSKSRSPHHHAKQTLRKRHLRPPQRRIQHEHG